MIRSLDDLSIENRENYDKVMQYLMNYAMFDLKIGVEFTNRLPPLAPPISYNKPGKLIIMNSNWIYPVQIPFLLAHEIGHVIHENQEFYHLTSMNTAKGEAEENLFALKLLHQYCVENEIYFNNIFAFAMAFGIPHDKWYILVDQQVIN